MSSFLFSAKGRINRAKYWLSILVYIGVMISLALLAGGAGIVGSSYSSYIERSKAASAAAGAESVPVESVEAVPADESTGDPATMSIPSSSGFGYGALLIPVLFVALFIALIYSTIVVQIKRWHDQNLSGWMFLINLTGIGSLVTFVMCGFFKGTSGPNRYGPDPLGGTPSAGP